MRRRILKMMIASVVAVGVMFGVPSTIIAWDWFSTQAHQDLAQRLKRVSEHVLAEESEGRSVRLTHLDLEDFRLLLPSNGRLTLTYSQPSATRPGGVELQRKQIGNHFTGPAVSESVNLATGADLTMSIPREDVRPKQLLAVAVLALAVLAAVGGGAMVAVVTARRLSEPLTHVAQRAEAMARGDFSADWPEYGIDELDRVTTALAEANAEIALRLEREGEIVGDVSHQLRSRLTAVHLRLDELTLHDDPTVVTEAEAGMEQVERLADELDEMVAVSRADSRARCGIDVRSVAGTLVHDLRPAFEARGRRLVMIVSDDVRDTYGRPGRLREALSVLIDNALVHGDGACTVSLAGLPSAEMMRITVADSGDGVADDIASDIFRRGFSGGSRSGYGLSLARALVEADGGRLDLVSRRPAIFAIVAPVLPSTETPAGVVRRGPVPHR
ncbi:HAMP domain-containing sensor histidine kinase [Gordonia shandongensis]|uniref:HAMP domain-containing sensor histidine kinase n=1 Tax=Gordonia shandongensis TaxID=376351 RepID=UPI00040932D6|nr:HAMP domain-containing sensor histidine kinase [Gordonia shandongensis]